MRHNARRMLNSDSVTTGQSDVTTKRLPVNRRRQAPVKTLCSASPRKSGLRAWTFAAWWIWRAFVTIQTCLATHRRSWQSYTCAGDPQPFGKQCQGRWTRVREYTVTPDISEPNRPKHVKRLAILAVLFTSHHMCFGVSPKFWPKISSV